MICLCHIKPRKGTIALALRDDWSLVGRVGAAHFSPRGTETQRVLFQLAMTKSPTWSPAPPAQPETANEIKTGTVQTKKALCTLMERREGAFRKSPIELSGASHLARFWILRASNVTVTRSVWASDLENGDLWSASFKDLLKSFVTHRFPSDVASKSYPCLGQRGLFRLHQAHFCTPFLCVALHFSLWQAVGAERGPPCTNYRSTCQLKGALPTLKSSGWHHQRGGRASWENTETIIQGIKMEIRHVCLIIVAQLVSTQVPAFSLHVRLVRSVSTSGFVACLIYAISNILTA